jgi:hypothetical protein
MYWFYFLKKGKKIKQKKFAAKKASQKNQKKKKKGRKKERTKKKKKMPAPTDEPARVPTPPTPDPYVPINNIIPHIIYIPHIPGNQYPKRRLQGCFFFCTFFF